MNESEWISIKEAAFLSQYSTDYFRRVFCAIDAPAVTIRVSMGPRGGKRILVSRESVMNLIRAQTRMAGELY